MTSVCCEDFSNSALSVLLEVTHTNSLFHDALSYTRKHFFASRVVEPWNNLPFSGTDFSSLCRFRRRLYNTNLEKFLILQYN